MESKKEHQIVNLAKEVPYLRNRKELKLYLKDLFVIEDYMTDKETYSTFITKIRNLVRASIRIQVLREYPIKFKFYKIDKETYTLELRHFYVNIILWEPFVMVNNVHTLDGSMIIDCYNDIPDILDYMNHVLIDKLKNFHIKTTKFNTALSNVTHNLRSISEDFSQIIGVNFSASTFVDAYNENPVIKELMDLDFDKSMQPNEIEDILNDSQNKIIEEFKNIKDNPIGLMLRAKTGIKPKQLREFIVAIGLKPSLTGETIPIPIPNSTLKGGLNKPSYYYIDAVGARKSLITNKKEMGKAGYYCKQVEISARTLTVSKTVLDCKTTHLVEYYVSSKKFLKKLGGKFYQPEGQNELFVINPAKDKHLIGKRIRVRSIATCACGENEVCARCIGTSVNMNNDILSGYPIYEAEETTSVLNQSILSTKHLLNTKTTMIEFNKEFDNYFTLEMGEINPKIDNSPIENIDDYAIYIEPQNIMKLEEQDYDSLFNNLIYNGKFQIVNIKDKSEVPVDIYTLEEKELFITEEAMALMKKGKGYIRFKDLDDDIKLFELVYVNNELTKPLYDFMNLTNVDQKNNNYTIDSMSQKLVELLIESDIPTNAISVEIILNRLIRKADNIYERPDFSKKTLEPYQITTIRKSLEYNKSPLIGLVFEQLKRQVLSDDFFEIRNGESYYDPLFKETVDMSNIKKYHKLGREEREKEALELAKSNAYQKRMHNNIFSL